MKHRGLGLLALVLGPWAVLYALGAAWPFLLLAVGFGAGWLVGVRSGRREAAYDAAREIVRGSHVQAFRVIDGDRP